MLDFTTNYDTQVRDAIAHARRLRAEATRNAFRALKARISRLLHVSASRPHSATRA